LRVGVRREWRILADIVRARNIGMGFEDFKKKGDTEEARAPGLDIIAGCDPKTEAVPHHIVK
jgi:hypothetical protein